MTLLRVEQLEVAYGPTRVLHGVDIEVGAGEVVCVLGRNGVGKTTLLRGILGLSRARGGRVEVDGDDVTRAAPFAIARRGVSYAAQEGGIFGGVSVRDNLKLGWSRGEATFAERLEEVRARFPVLAERLDQKAGTLSGGEQKLLVAARALAAGPRLALLDEVTEGVQPSFLERIGSFVRDANEKWGTAVLLVEQNLRFALELAARFYVIEKGQVVESGDVTEDAVDAIQRHLVL